MVLNLKTKKYLIFYVYHIQMNLIILNHTVFKFETIIYH